MARGLSFLTGLAGGYMSQSAKSKELERQEKLDAQAKELHDARMDEIRSAKADKETLRDANKSATLDTGTVVTDGTGNKSLYKAAPDAAAMDSMQAEADMRREAAGQEGPATVTSATGYGLSAPAKGQAKIYSDQASADQALGTYNSAGAKSERILSAMDGIDPLKGQGLRRDITQGKLADVQLRGAEEAQLRDKVFRTAVSGFAQGGWPAVPKLYEQYNDGRTAKVTEDGKGGALVNLFNAKGEPAGEKFYASGNDFIQGAIAQLDPKLWVASNERRDERAQTQSNADRSFGLQERGVVVQEKNAGQAAALQGVQLKAAELAYNKAVEENKVPSAVKMQVDGAREELKSIGAAMSKAQAEGTWAADGAGAKQLMERQAILGNIVRDSLRPFMPQGDKAPAAQPFGAPRAAGAKMAPISYKDPRWDNAEAAAAAKAGIPVELLRSIRVNGEKSNGDQVSPKGAQGVYQFIPSSRDAFLKKYKVDAYSDDLGEQSLAAAYHLKEGLDRNGGDAKKAAAGYNGGISGEKGTNKTAENRDYVIRVARGLGSAQAQAQAASRPSRPAPSPVASSAVPGGAQPTAAKSPQSLGDDFESADARAALGQRVAEAAKGGEPLSQVETLRARQLRLVS